METPRRPRTAFTVRGRLLTAVVVLVALGLLVAGGTAYLLQLRRVDDGIDAALDRTVEEFSVFAGTAVNPETSAPFTDLYDLLYWGIEREVPARHEGMAGFVDGDFVLTQSGGLEVRADPELVDHLTAQARAGVGRVATVTTSRSEYRYAVVPVVLEGAGEGTLAVVFDRRAEQAPVDQTFRTYALVALAATVVTAVVGWLLAGRLLKPLRDLRATAERISESDLSGRIDVRGDDDVSELARTFNAMLTRLQEAFVSQRQLLDDAGHELRTPITVLRGHLELMDPADPADSAAVRELALGELDRMHRLTDDLVLLARSERPDFVRLTPTSVGELTDAVLDLARRLGDRRWAVEARAETVVPLDSQRLTQAWLQLADNAVKFSAAGTVVALGSALRGDRLHVWVRDEGVGVSDEDRERIFARFTRTAAAGPTPGAGLGLPIVGAIAAAHGGRVEVRSTPGRGSVFLLDLPAGGATEEPPGEEGPVEDRPPADPGAAPR